MKRWEITAKNTYRANLRKCLHLHLQYEKQKYAHKDLAPSRISRDEKDVQAVIDVLTNVFIHPFSDIPLASISTGIVVSEDIAARIIDAKCQGINEMNQFIDNRLGPESKLSFFDRIKRCKTPTFDSIKKVKTCKTKNKVVSIESSKDLFSKISIIAQSRRINLCDLFTYPLGAVPLALAEVDGSLKKTPKSALLHKIEGDIPPIPDIPDDCALIVDGMAVVRQIKTSNITYQGLSTKLLRHILSIGASAKRIDVVFDVYIDKSIKDVERNRRSSGQLTLQQIIPSSVIKQWNLLLSSNHNKTMLIEFLVDQWKQQSQLLASKVLFVTCGAEAFKICSTGCHHIRSLDSNHEEADTRLLLHAKHASQNHEKIVINSPDTDVFIIAMSKSLEIDAHLYFITGTKEKRRIIDIEAVADYAYNSINTTDCEKSVFLDALVGYHCFTGCDSISAFSGRGKIKPLILMGKHKTYVETFSTLGKLDSTDECINAIEKFVCHMYGKADDDASINSLRYNMCCQRNGKIAIDMLPPCFNVLIQHVRRANYQARIWHKSLERNALIGSPEDNGWTIKDDKLYILWMTCNAAPDEVNRNYYINVWFFLRGE